MPKAEAHGCSMEKSPPAIATVTSKPKPYTLVCVCVCERERESDEKPGLCSSQRPTELLRHYTTAFLTRVPLR